VLDDRYLSHHSAQYSRQNEARMRCSITYAARLKPDLLAPRARKILLVWCYVQVGHACVSLASVFVLLGRVSKGRKYCGFLLSFCLFTLYRRVVTAFNLFKSLPDASHIANKVRTGL
jgi:hypothetical protein